MVRKSRVLVEIEADAGLPYERTALAQQAKPARRRLAWLLIAAALAMLVEALAQRSGWWIAGAAAAAGSALGVRRGRLGATICAAFVAALGVMLPLRLFFIAERDLATLAGLALSVALGIAMLPSLVTLVRDHELQNAFGLWARRR